MTSFGQIFFRGLSCKCPACGKGKLFYKYLKVVDACPECGEEMHHHRADDAPAYIVLLLLCHFIIPAVLMVEDAFSPPTWVQLAIWFPASTIFALLMLPPVKGVVVALQWYYGFHGFEEAKKRRMNEVM